MPPSCQSQSQGRGMNPAFLLLLLVHVTIATPPLIHHDHTIQHIYTQLETALRAIEQSTALTPDQKELSKKRMIRLHVDHVTNQILLETSNQDQHDHTKDQEHRQHSIASPLLQQKQPRRKLLMESQAQEGISEEDIGSALTEPTPECRRILNVWTSKCVFGR
jgi:hypothetical protein